MKIYIEHEISSGPGCYDYERKEICQYFDLANRGCRLFNEKMTEYDYKARLIRPEKCINALKSIS